jgi:Rrf2 family transcriptional regulator, iron-sulfur cluster assembly transcription factor
MLFSKPWTYAIRALLYLAEHRKEGPILSSQIADAENIPASYLVKILGTLNGTRIISSTRGPGGGYSLLKNPESIRLLDIVTPFESVDLFDNCILGLGHCSDNDQCPVHKRWKDTKLQLIQFLEETTLADVMVDSHEVLKKRRKK